MTLYRHARPPLPDATRTRAALRATALATLLALAACSTPSADHGYAAVQQQLRQRGAPQAAWPHSDADAATLAHTVATLLAKPLTVDDAVQVALLNNRRLRADYGELGIAEADLVQAGRLPNPTLSFSRLHGGDGIDIERRLLLPVMNLLTMPITRGLEQGRFEHAQLRAAGAALRVADATRRAYYGALAAQQSGQYMEQVEEAAAASAELARRMLAAGNWSKLQQAREQAFHADAVAQLARARQTALAEREQLARLLGVADGAFQLPERLPELPAEARALRDAEVEAIGNRLDILMAQKELAGLAAALGLSRATRFVNLLDLSYLRNSAGERRARGYELELQIPLFDWGDARLAKSQTLYTQAVDRAAATAVEARSELRQRYAAYQGAYTLARHYRDEIVPLKKRISDEQMLRYNGMLISVFELLADAREQVLSVNAAIEAQRDYWIADAALQAAIGGTPAATN